MRPDIDGQAERSNEREHMSQRGREPVQMTGKESVKAFGVRSLAAVKPTAFHFCAVRLAMPSARPIR